MTDRIEAMRLADELDAEVVRTVSLDVMHTKAAALLRQLSAERDQLRAEVERLTKTDAEILAMSAGREQGLREAKEACEADGFVEQFRGLNEAARRIEQLRGK